ncbi:XrtA/PEP-CTERM system amidotransferase [Thiohalorhabdus denitrificans]|uniref:asparagine synthase (glutamine-hydrolyzing) n=1 Tax=Thiohalorhabdus denitrificans TaxID=381306 RepID=A0A1G5DCE6_9GAMM|nr:XrtA/PEP-CTERM system amidotransferase [Thiohalorhabdus denitrificans]SCY12433.1 asparagine synthase (glutamine-hydrolysing) [Thiohalorhabdus denitrificans]
MCGLVGLFDTRDTRPMDRGLVEAMNQRLYHRGPDGGGVHVEPGIGLGHRRLAIIDLDGGDQPLFSEDGKVAVVYNGEVYNFRELAGELRDRGYRFRTRCDTEVVLQAWREWGPNCVHRFRGMFALAIWDRDRQSVFLARDRMGIKPLYYALLDDGTLAFASELKALLPHPGVSRDLDPAAVEEYFAFGYVPDPRTILKGVRKLPPAHRLMVCRGQPVPEPEAYWDVAFAEGDSRPAEDSVAEELTEKLSEAVGMRRVADVPVGAFLSGGVDSSAVVAMLARADDEPVRTCSISFGDPRYNEAAHAARVAERYGTDHTVSEVDPSDFDLVDRLAGIYDEPFADSSAMPTYRVCEQARKRVTVALSGDGGDESFGGYRRYRWHVHEEQVRRRVPQALRGPLFGALARVYPKLNRAPRVLRAKATLESVARDSLDAYLDNMGVVPEGIRRAMFSDRMRRDLQGYHAVEVLRGHARRAPDHPLSQVQYLDMKTYLPGDILTKVDRASMAHSLEVRVPVLDHEFVEWAAALPPRYKYRQGEGKYLFKKALRPYLPDEVLYRPKMGFAVPVDRWFRGPLRDRVREALLGPDLQDTGLFDRAALERILEEHQSGKWDHGAVLWSLLMFAAFLRQLDREPVYPGAAPAAGRPRPAASQPESSP